LNTQVAIAMKLQPAEKVELFAEFVFNGVATKCRLNVQAVSADMKNKMAAAINALPKDASPEQCLRAAQCVIIALDVWAGMSRESREAQSSSDFSQVLKSLFAPRGELSGTDIEIAHKALAKLADLKKPINKTSFKIESERQAVIAMKPAEKVELFVGFVKTEVTRKAMSKSAVERFMLSHTEGTTEDALRGIRARAAARSIGEECFRQAWTETLAVLKSMGNFDYGRDQIENDVRRYQRGEKATAASVKRAKNDAQAAYVAMDEVMPLFLGGNDEAAIDDAVGKLPQHFCDLVAKARQALDQAQFAGDAETAAGKKRLQANLDAYLLGGVLGALFNEAQYAARDPEAFGVAFGQFKTLLLAIANGARPWNFTPLSEAQQDFEDSTLEWGRAYRLFMDKAADRGAASTTSD
jgi:hypothetical protein